jgi:hypothetical protein
MTIFGKLMKRHLEYIHIGRQCGCTKNKIVCRLYLYVEAYPDGKKLFGRQGVDRGIILIWILRK